MLLTQGDKAHLVPFVTPQPLVLGPPCPPHPMTVSGPILGQMTWQAHAWSVNKSPCWPLVPAPWPQVPALLLP